MSGPEIYRNLRDLRPATGQDLALTGLCIAVGIVLGSLAFAASLAWALHS